MDKGMQTKRNVSLWALYDFANSAVSIVFFLYFSQWVVIDKGVSDFRFNLSFSLSALLLLLTVPVTGVLLDGPLRRITGLRWSTVFAALFYGTCAIAAIYGREYMALIFFTLGLYSYLLSFTFYTPLIKDIAPEPRRGFVSGLGIAANYAGQFTGLLIALPFSNGTWSWFGSAPRAETLLPSVIAFFALSLPMLFFFRESVRPARTMPFRKALGNVLHETKALLSHSGVGLFFGAYFLFNDAVLTASTNLPLFLEQVWHVTDTVKTYLLLAILVTCAIGGFVSGFIADRYGHKRTLAVILFGWILLLPLVGLLSSFPWFVGATVMMGFWFGATWAVSRSVMSYIAPAGQNNLAFAYFGLAERASSFVGPVVWGLTVSNLVLLGAARYRIAMVAISVFILFGCLMLMRVQVDERKSA
ncbi:MAG: MFS transporter [bacterium]|nr:MFS transporter [bacterium]